LQADEPQVGSPNEDKRKNLEVVNLMKNTMRALAIGATLALLPAAANLNELKAQTPAAPAAQGQCTDESKAAWYADFIKFRTTDATKAYENAKRYLTACPTEEGQVPAYLKKWVAAYEREARKLKLTDLFVNQRKYADALALAKEILIEEPDYLPAIIDLGYGGYVVAVTTKNDSGNPDAINYTKRAIQAIESGKAPESWIPFKSKDDTLGYLYYSLAYLERTINPTVALSDFIKAAQFDSEIKKNPQIYVFIAASYENEYAKQSADYVAKYKDKDETPESKLAVANINQLVDRVIDALARAVAAAGSDAPAQASKAQWLSRLTELYKFRHNDSDTGLNEMIASVLSKPLPPVPTPLTALPAAPTTSTVLPANGSTTATSTAAAPKTATPTATSLAPNKTTVPAANTTVAKKSPTTTETASAKPAAKPKTRNNHRH
jgi:hypothetical protein